MNFLAAGVVDIVISNSSKDAQGCPCFYGREGTGFEVRVNGVEVSLPCASARRVMTIHYSFLAAGVVDTVIRDSSMDEGLSVSGHG